LFALAFTINLLLHHDFGSTSEMPFDSSVERMGLAMLNTGDGGFVLPFEAVSMLLLAAMIGCIVIAMKVKKEEAK
jgi:NADH-quinone oxidoreductase subunit J